jgi:hypothetical protein
MDDMLTAVYGAYRFLDEKNNVTDVYSALFER